MNDLARDLHAAEKTLEVLKAKVVDLYNGTDDSLIARQLRAARRREEENRRKQEVMAVRQQALEHHSRELEAEVARRTAEMRAILDHVTFGFVLVGPNLEVLEGYTKSCNRLLGCDSDLTGQSFSDLLGVANPFCYQLSFEQVFEDIMPEEVSLAQLPTRFELKNGNVLGVDPSVIRGADGAVSAVLMTVSDIGALEAAQNENRTNRILVSILKGRSAFLGFLGEAKTNIVVAKDSVSRGDLITARRALHTVKGNAASYDLNDVVECVHSLEELETIDAVGVAKVEQELRAFLLKHAAILEIDYDSDEGEQYRLSVEQFSNLKMIATGAQVPQLRRWTAEVARKPAMELLGPLEQFVGRLAERLGKEIEFELQGADTPVDVDTMRPVFSLLSHLIRNAIDHGIETKAERGTKEPIGRLIVSIGSDGKNYFVRVSDDGRGIDVQRLTDKAIELGHLSLARAQEMSLDEKIELVFMDGLSAAQETTDISGRGVGMSAVRSEVKRLYGSVKLATELGQGTTIELVVPKPEVLQASSLVPPSASAAQ